MLAITLAVYGGRVAVVQQALERFESALWCLCCAQDEDLRLSMVSVIISYTQTRQDVWPRDVEDLLEAANGRNSFTSLRPRTTLRGRFKTIRSKDAVHQILLPSLVVRHGPSTISPSRVFPI